MTKLTVNNRNLKILSKQLDGELHFDQISKILFATDASAYREIPQAVVFPASRNDIKTLINFARENKTSLIPRGAGTSLAGQVVGKGIVVDISKYLNKIIEVNKEEKWVRVEPGVVLSELNLELKKYGLMVGPETSTANRCTMGGMLGNNSCGLHSLVHGSIRDHILEVEAILSDGSDATFSPIDTKAFHEKLKGSTLENNLYRFIHQVLSDEENRLEISTQYPDPSVPRRNNGYALDIISSMQPFNPDGGKFNFSKLIAGSEGTLAFVTEMKLGLVPLPPSEKALICIHFSKLEDVFKANLIGLKHNPSAIELMDKTILDLTRGNIGLRHNRFFINGEPEAILIIELWGESKEEIISQSELIETEMRSAGFGYDFPLIWGADIQRVWALRTAGLGVLSNVPGDAKSVSVVEDTAVPVEQLPGYMADFQKMLDKYSLKAVYHAHIATGELHLRPVLNLKDPRDVELFRTVARETAALVKKYNGSLSGEHGDGRLRGEFIPFMLGEKVYGLLKELKHNWDPDGIFNPGKITDTPLMDQSLRYSPGQATPEFKEYFDYKLSLGLARAIERCNGSGDCRKTEISGGTMCPSYMATRDEMHSTRGRANILRELATRPSDINWADNRDILYSLDLCLSCKACKSECPSGVDIARLKAEFLQNHYDGNPVPFRAKIIGGFPGLMILASKFRLLYNAVAKSKIPSSLVSIFIGFSTKRPLPVLSKITLEKWYRKHERQVSGSGRKVYLFNDEFLNVNDSHIGVKAILLLEKLGYDVAIPKHTFSGRTYFSKGLVLKARRLAERNVESLCGKITDETPLIGIEPSAILSFRDEYPDLVRGELKRKAEDLASNALMFDEFIMREVDAGRIKPEMFTSEPLKIKLHGHCHQKALATTAASIKMLELPVNFKVEEIPSGCCGMAGSFGYEKEHYDLSMKIGELVLFPEVRKTPEDVVIAAPGTSCREQIAHGTGRKAFHPVEILFDALR
ncbi:MAG: FAD-binding protein [Prolixibacteraceae bacterium]|nr:FAD-binding protein [Prolixibacteraceae bacterium]